MTKNVAARKQTDLQASTHLHLWLSLVLSTLPMACGKSQPGPHAPDDAGPMGVAPASDPRTATERLYLSGHDRDDAVEWEFMINTGRRAHEAATIPVPSNWEFHGFGDFQYGFNPSNERGIYRTQFFAPTGWLGRRVKLVFEGVMTDTTVSVNGRSAGPTHQGGFYRFQRDISALLSLGAPNELEVIVDEQSANQSVNEAERNADYWTFGGIFRPVYLEASPPQSLDRLAVNARATGELTADVYLQGVDADAQITAQILDASGMPVADPLTAVVTAGSDRVTVGGHVAGIHPWSAEAPNLYTLEVQLSRGAETLHVLRDRFGFRTVEVRPGDGVYVNDSKVRLKGVNRHSFWPSSGRALSAQVSRNDIELVKSMNMNAVRSSHYPPDKHFLDAADELGVYVLDELAGWQSPPYDEEVGRPLVAEMVTFDVNHPSILFWDNGNEGGWNPALDADFSRWDPQARRVLHPWALFSEINTDHYETYASHVNLLAGPNIFLPTEFLHGLYDGGGGAGLDDFWNAVVASRVGAGGFLWALLDEGVQRSPGVVDVAGNAAPDGIVGPFREKEGSFYSVRQIWSPVQIALDSLPAGFAGTLPVENRYDFTDLNTVVFNWSLVGIDFSPGDPKLTVSTSGVARTGSIPARGSGVLELPLPSDWAQSHALLLDALDASGRLLAKWSWVIQTPAALRTSVIAYTPNGPAATAGDAGPILVSPAGTDAGAPGAPAVPETLDVTTSQASFAFNTATCQLTGVQVNGAPFSLSNGPRLVPGTGQLQSLRGERDGNDYVVTCRSSGDLERIVWRVMSNGWLALSYRYSLTGSFSYMGVSFDYPESLVQGVRWLGRGPHRVWKNRMRGPWHGLWERDKNDAVTGQVWQYPEFKGYFADVYWAQLRTQQGPIDIVTDTPGMFLRLYTARDGNDPGSTAMPFPGGDLSFLQGIPAIGTKFDEPSRLGPQSQPHVLNGQAFEATVYFKFGGRLP